MTGRGASRVYTRWWFSREDYASLSGCWCWCGLRGYPSIDAGLDSSSRTVVWDRLVGGQMYAVANDGGTPGVDILFCHAAVANLMACEGAEVAGRGSGAEERSGGVGY